MRQYETDLRRWSAAKRTGQGDRRFLASMREAHAETIPLWAQAGVWKIFSEIRKALKIEWDEIASVNLARCHDPEPDGNDDAFIPGCQRSFPLDDLVKRVRPRLVFLAKGGTAGNAVRITGERDGEPPVVRYATSWSGQRNGKHYREWIAEESAAWLKLIGA